MLKAMDEEEEAEAEGTEEGAEAGTTPPPKKDDGTTAKRGHRVQALATAERPPSATILATRPDWLPRLRASLENVPVRRPSAPCWTPSPRVSVNPPAQASAPCWARVGAW